MNGLIQSFFDSTTKTISYVVYESPGSSCAIIDSVLDYDFKSGRTQALSAQKIVEFIHKHELKVEWILETHAHADHVSAAYYLKRLLGGKIAISEKIKTVQGVFKKIFNLDHEFKPDGEQFDYLFADDESFYVGRLKAKALSVPGHTPADIAYQIGDAIFVGDTLFMPDVGTARCDFPGGDAHLLYHSIQKLFAFPNNTRLFMCHDYPPDEREPRWETTVDEQKTSNIHILDGISEKQFVEMRTARDRTLEMPALILPSIQINIRAGDLPPAEENGVHYLKIPLNML